MDTKKITIGVIAILVIALVGYRVGSAGGGAAMTLVEVEGLDDTATLVALAQGNSIGEDDAPITIVEFGDFQCGGCMQFNQGSKPQILLSLVETGEARYVYYDLPLVSIHAFAFLAARASRCAADQGEYWAYHDALFANQPRWALSGTAPIGDFVGYAVDVGLDRGEFNSCLRSDRHADVVTANFMLAQQLGATGTPTVMVSLNGSRARLVTTQNFFGIQNAIAALREEQGGGED